MSDMEDDDAPMSVSRRRPNILITGSPGVGKTCTAASIAKTMGSDMVHVNVGKFAEEHKCYEGRDEELDTNILDEDKLLDLLEIQFQQLAAANKGIVADFHVCEIFPERFFDLVLVLRTKTETLFDRLTARGYSERKRSENMEAEIMQVILEEARASYATEIVHEVPSNTVADLQSNVQRACQWCDQWVADHT
ncbi:kinase isoenzyme 6 [Seminavis robusta]|uniref:Adenylate kinase isoenzyme 6 homolog n=1 Tax=Seminavis robusta TaxID=568900 RepID=A0A9N8HMT5_9STRA|nr:kinase isoenzyme 6 [Seminavis robusta]|eukprot:Sro770_g199980.1 kinase isoenzyme 6 (193) ;mRNA; f:24884-25681